MGGKGIAFSLSLINHAYRKGSLKTQKYTAKNYPLVFYSLKIIPRVSLELFSY